MIINHTLGFIYIHVPKSGGTSVTQYLSQFTTWRDLEIGSTEFGEAVQAAYIGRFNMRKHIPAFHLRSIIGDEAWKAFYKISTIRSPYTRFLSTFNFLTRNKIYSGNDYVRYMKSFSDINAFICEGDFFNEKVPDYMFLPQVYWLGGRDNFHDSKEIIVDEVVKLEELDKFSNLVDKKFNVQSNSNIMPINNVSEYGSDLLNEESMIIIEKVYHQDFDIFGYKKILAG